MVIAVSQVEGSGGGSDRATPFGEQLHHGRCDQLPQFGRGELPEKPVTAAVTRDPHHLSIAMDRQHPAVELKAKQTAGGIGIGEFGDGGL